MGGFFLVELGWVVSKASKREILSVLLVPLRIITFSLGIERHVSLQAFNHTKLNAGVKNLKNLKKGIVKKRF